MSRCQAYGCPCPAETADGYCRWHAGRVHPPYRDRQHPAPPNRGAR